MSERQASQTIQLKLRACRQLSPLYDQDLTEEDLADSNAGPHAAFLQKELYEVTGRLVTDEPIDDLVTLYVPPLIFDKLNRACQTWSSVAGAHFSQHSNTDPHQTTPGAPEAAKIFESGPAVKMAAQFQVMSTKHKDDTAGDLFTTARVKNVQKLEIDGVDALAPCSPVASETVDKLVPNT